MTLVRVPAVDVERVEVNRRGQRSYWLAAP
jgi:hypothetical protein